MDEITLGELAFGKKAHKEQMDRIKKTLREILNGIYLDALGTQKLDIRIANGTVNIAHAEIFELIPSEEEIVEMFQITESHTGILLAKAIRALIVKKLK